MSRPAVVASASASVAAFTLPDGWKVELKARNVTDRAFHIDKYYIELGTGKKFRSLKEVQRYLNGEEVRRKPPSSSASSSRKRDEQPAPSYDEVPQSVNWKLVSLEGTHMLKAYVDGREVPASVSREWREEASQGWEVFAPIRKFRKLD